MKLADTIIAFVDLELDSDSFDIHPWCHRRQLLHIESVFKLQTTNNQRCRSKFDYVNFVNPVFVIKDMLYGPQVVFED